LDSDRFSKVTVLVRGGSGLEIDDAIDIFLIALDSVGASLEAEPRAFKWNL
jgi:hypothetical protein